MTTENRVLASSRASGILTSDRPIVRLSALSGCIFAVLVLISSFVTGSSPPSNGSSLSTIINYYTQHHTAVLIGDYLIVIAAYFLYGFIVSLRNAVRRSESGEPVYSAGGYAAGVTLVALLVVEVAVDAALDYKAIKIGVGSPGGLAFIRGMFDLGFLLFAFSGIAAAGVVLSTSLATLRTGVFPTWIGYFGLLVGVLDLLSPLSVFAETENILTAITLVASFLFLAWTFVVSVLLTRQVSRVSGELTP